MLTIIRKNISAVMQRDGIPSGNALAKLAKVDQKTISSILSSESAPNPTLKVITAISKALKLEPWMLLVPDMPVDIIQGSRIKTISHQGYRLLKIFESAPENNKISILDFAAYSMKTDPVKSSSVQEIRATYGQPQQNR